MLWALSPRLFHTGVWHQAVADPPTDGVAWSIRHLLCFHFLFQCQVLHVSFPSSLVLPLLVLSLGCLLTNLDVSDCAAPLQPFIRRWESDAAKLEIIFQRRLTLPRIRQKHRMKHSVCKRYLLSLNVEKPFTLRPPFRRTVSISFCSSITLGGGFMFAFMFLAESVQ